MDQIAQSVTTYIDGVAQETDHHYFTYDGHGSTRALLDITATILQLYSFDAYGNAIDFNPTSALTEYLYSGEQFDSKIGQQYLRARYYDPATGRFNSLDSFFGNLDDPQSLHKYLYTHVDPINGIDPTGMFLGGMSLNMCIQITLSTLNVHGMVSNTLNAIKHSISSFEALQAGNIWDGIAYAALATLDGLFAALNWFGMKSGMTPPPGAGALKTLTPVYAIAGGGSYAYAIPMTAKVWQTIELCKPLAIWVYGSLLPAVLGNSWSNFSSNFDITSSNCSFRVGRETRPRLDTGNEKEGWIHIDQRHISGTSPKGPGDLFPKGTTKNQIEQLTAWLVSKGNRISDPKYRIQVFERHTTFNGQHATYRTLVDTGDGNRIITTFPVLSE